MKKMSVCLGVVCCVVFVAGIAVAQQKGPIEQVLEGCKQEFETYCKNVTPGEGRLLACLYSYNDKISSRCEYAIYDAAAQLERALNAIAYVANECRDDLKKYCSDVKPGEGRLIECIAKKKDAISDRCKTAIKDVAKQ